MIKHSEYFEGNVQSLSVEGHEKPATVGVMSVGEYKFGTDAAEVMNVVKGELQVQLPGETEWKSYTDGTAFSVEGNSSFLVKVPVSTVYLCVYG